LLLTGVAPAVAADDEAACRQSYIAGQRRYKLEHDLLGGREQLLVCARTCPDALRASCGRWLQEIEGELPSIVVTPKDRTGRDVLDATIAVDGAPLVGHTEGTPIDLNPGEHRVEVDRKGFLPAQETVVVAAGEKLRVVEVWTEPRAIEPVVAEVRRRPVPLASAVLAGAGVLFLASFGVFAAWTTVEYDQTGSCAPACPASSRDPSFTAKTVIADTSLAAGGAALIAAGIFYLVRPDVVSRSPAARIHPSAGGVVVRF
jgi:hypothetical protein